MNVGAHIAVAAVALGHRANRPQERAEHDGVLLGSALPDLASMGRFRLLGSTDDDAVAAGIRLHHRTDDLFHRHPWFRGHSRAVTTELGDAGLARGAATACGHVGVELLLDGRLLTADDVADAVLAGLATITPRIADLASLVPAERETAWSSHLARLSRSGLPSDYDDPDAVANRLHRIVSFRPRLAFDADQIPVVSEVLHRHRDGIWLEAFDLVADLGLSLGDPLS